MKDKLKYLFLLLVSCGNDHLRGQSDYHFLAGKYPKLTVKLKKVGKDDFFITQLGESGSNGMQTNSKKECSLDFDLKDENDNDVSHEKEIEIQCSDGREFSIKINFIRQYQLLNFNLGPGKIYHLKNISTNLPGADIKTDYKNKILYSTYRGENVVEIEY